MNFVFQHAFYCPDHDRSLRFISYLKLLFTIGTFPYKPFYLFFHLCVHDAHDPHAALVCFAAKHSNKRVRTVVSFAAVFRDVTQRSPRVTSQLKRLRRGLMQLGIPVIEGE